MTDIGPSKRFNSWHNKRFPLSRYWVPRDSIEIDSTHLAFGHTILVVFGGSVVTKDWVHGVGHSLVCKILFQIVVRAMITFSPPAWTSSAGMLSTLADFPFFNDCTAASISLRRMGWSCPVSVWRQFSTDGSPMFLWLYSSDLRIVLLDLVRVFFIILLFVKSAIFFAWAELTTVGWLVRCV